MGLNEDKGHRNRVSTAIHHDARGHFLTRKESFGKDQFSIGKRFFKGLIQVFFLFDDGHANARTLFCRFDDARNSKLTDDILFGRLSVFIG